MAFRINMRSRRWLLRRKAFLQYVRFSNNVVMARQTIVSEAAALDSRAMVWLRRNTVLIAQDTTKRF